jgi:hypothetical protein
MHPKYNKTLPRKNTILMGKRCEQFTKENIWVDNKFMQRQSKCLVIMKMLNYQWIIIANPLES